MSRHVFHVVSFILSHFIAPFANGPGCPDCKPECNFTPFEYELAVADIANRKVVLSYCGAHEILVLFLARGICVL